MVRLRKCNRHGIKSSINKFTMHDFDTDKFRILESKVVTCYQPASRKGPHR